jgi:hypothetical protein
MKKDPVPHVPGLLLFTQYEGAALSEQVAICPPIQRYSVQLNTDPQTLRAKGKSPGAPPIPGLERLFARLGKVPPNLLVSYLIDR